MNRLIRAMRLMDMVDCGPVNRECAKVDALIAIGESLQEIARQLARLANPLMATSGTFDPLLVGLGEPVRDPITAIPRQDVSRRD